MFEGIKSFFKRVQSIFNTNIFGNNKNDQHVEVSAPNVSVTESKTAKKIDTSRAKAVFRRLVKDTIKKVDISRDPTLLRLDIQRRSPHYRQELLTGKHLNRDSPIRVHQMTDAERERCKLKVKDGVLYYANVRDNLGRDIMVDTSRMNNKGKPGFITFVIGEDNNLYIANRNAKYAGSDTFTHASFFQGRPVKFAGLIKIVNGKVEAYDDDSGHYYPDKGKVKVHMYNATKILNEQNVLSRNCQLICHADEASQIRSTPTKFLMDMDRITTKGGKSQYNEQVERMKEGLERDRKKYKEKVSLTPTKRTEFKFLRIGMGMFRGKGRTQ